MHQDFPENRAKSVDWLFGQGVKIEKKARQSYSAGLF